MKTNSKPVMLGGSPLFSETVKLANPTLPEYPVIEEELKEIFDSGMITKGQHLEEFESMTASYLGVKHAIAVSSCTSGLMLAYQALEIKDQVIVPSFTFMATVSSMIWAGAEPKFVDVDLHTKNIDTVKLKSAIDSNVRAIVAVHNFGNPADIKELESIAKEFGLSLIFDAAHGIGSIYNGKKVGSQGDIQVFSLSPTKLLVTGEGGIVATNNSRIAEKIRIGREYGNDGTYNSIFPGLNARMPEFNALLGKYGLEKLDEDILQRNKIAEIYRENLKDVPGISFQFVKKENRSSYKDFAIFVEPEEFGLTRDQLSECLNQERIETRNYYDPPVHKHTAYKKFQSNEADLTNTNLLARNSICLPVWSHLETQIVLEICSVIKNIHFYAKEINSLFSKYTVN